ncbi:AsnC family transcriptional regulator [Terasakiella brassicae]|uniref:AsnC family transcriptional regulator n=1 Tax=Terasakiella brassicae TaxID=1634917 RepID=A0A917C035_9PROT|nr:Lrp/AsnC family transcriptional regulator [Terasakiella brassicae]GGF64076.1 AsnC family transcriptional regulator [Terasakiella brassicae]
MDKIDRNIVTILQKNADVTNAALAEQVNLSPSSCLRRVQRLKRTGVIKKTVAIIDDKVLGRNLIAVVEVDLDRHGAQAQAVLHERLRQEISVTQAYGITGESDCLLILKLADMDEYRQVCERLFNHDKNVIRFRTSFVMNVIQS